MSFRDERGRSRRDYPSRSEDKPYHGRGSNPRSRHLWVGNIPHSLTESDVAHHFLHFGELESIAFQPGRSYAFINYRNEEDAYDAFKKLQGFVIEGNPLRIEYTKAEKSLVPPREADYSGRRDNSHPRGRGSPFSSRDSRMRYSSPELSHSSKSRMSDKNTEPSEVLWIGFPAQLKVDEFVLRKAFSPFGEIEKITAFPGRAYAFVRFRDVISASRAKEALQGKLFGNPRVHICFAKNDMGTTSRERNSLNSPPSPHSGKYGRAEYFDDFRSDRDFSHLSRDPSIRSPPYTPNLDRGMRNTNSWSDHPYSPPRNIGGHMRKFSPKGFPRQDPIYDDPWDFLEEAPLMRGAKKLKTETFDTDNELPEYPLSDLEKSKHVPSRDIPHPRLLDNNDSRHSGYRPHLVNTSQPFIDRGGHWNDKYDDFQAASLPMAPLDRRKLTPDSRESSSREVWRWEGMIAKGGTAVCRARCFPVGKPPDMILPEILDCTARTSLDMLAKHYYQASSAWVVFFAPANDPDISYYNEFLSYLEEKQRAAVVKLDERNTLFLVPPSDFSEKVLKVPGKLSISGVVLRLDAPGSSFGSLHQNENRETPFISFKNDSVYHTPVSPPVPYLPPPPPFHTNPSLINDAQGHEYARKNVPGANFHPHDYQNSNPYYAVSRPMQEAAGHSSYTQGGNSDGRWKVSESSPAPSSLPVSGLPQEQLVQLASSLIGQHGQMSGVSSSNEYKPSGLNINQQGYQHRNQQNYGLLPNNNQSSSDFPPSEYDQPPNSVASQREGQVNLQQLQVSEHDDPDADPQRRLEATLQLAAALLQQIQQGKGN